MVFIRVSRLPVRLHIHSSGTCTSLNCLGAYFALRLSYRSEGALFIMYLFVVWFVRNVYSLFVVSLFLMLGFKSTYSKTGSLGKGGAVKFYEFWHISPTTTRMKKQHHYLSKGPSYCPFVFTPSLPLTPGTQPICSLPAALSFWEYHLSGII